MQWCSFVASERESLVCYLQLFCALPQHVEGLLCYHVVVANPFQRTAPYTSHRALHGGLCVSHKGASPSPSPAKSTALVQKQVTLNRA